MNILDKAIEVIEIYDIYQDLLTDKQKEYMESYYYNNYSITEIAENFEVSRNAIFDQLKRTTKKLYDYENKLELRQKNKSRRKIFKRISEEKDLTNILDLVEELEKVE
ncbi:MAG: hypothetical protein KAH16_02275 [Candidatus Izimaplasma sp.]|nr:hypothetical protein [Candidatus Izimaplasma bacterium]